MPPQCVTCGHTIVLGGVTVNGKRFCREDCARAHPVVLAMQGISDDLLDQHVEEIFHSECPLCGEEAALDVYEVSKVTSFLVVYRISEQTQLSCAPCGRMLRLKAAAHCMFLGPWGPISLFWTICLVPAHLIKAMLIRDPEEPSAALRQHVKLILGQKISSRAARRRPKKQTVDDE